jgi:hypothetical protein
MSWILSQLLHILRLDDPAPGSSGNGPLENLLERVEDFFQRFAEHFFHPHPCPPDQASGSSEATNGPGASPGANGSAGSGGTHSSDSTQGNDECGPISHPAGDGDSTHRWPSSNPDRLPQCNLPGFGSTDKKHAGDEQASPRSEREAAPSDHQLGSNLAQLVQALASHLGNGTGFDSGSSSHIVSDPAPLTTVAAAWNQ